MRRAETFLITPFRDMLQWNLLLSHTVKTPWHMLATTDAAAGNAQVRDLYLGHTQEATISHFEEER